MAIECDPVSLVEASKCFQCADGALGEAMVAQLLCQWASSASPGTIDYRITDDSTVRVTDTGDIRIVMP